MVVMSMFKHFFPNIHKEGIIFVIIGLISAIILGFISSYLSALMIMLSIFIIFFFRDPERVTPVGENLITAPADGIITFVGKQNLPKNLDFDNEEVYKVSIFLSVFDVHVNRIPTDGRIKRKYYHKGKFCNATLDKSSEDNERLEILMENKAGQEIVFVQIAGLIARRIVCYIEEGQEVKGGARFGIIRFGSRMDVYLPKGVKPLVFVGQKVIGAETILADMEMKDGREGEIR